jgi:hypothetical protein
VPRGSVVFLKHTLTLAAAKTGTANGSDATAVTAAQGARQFL